MGSPHGAEGQEAIEQCVHQIIRHVGTESLRAPLPLLRGTRFRPAEEHKSKV